MVDGAVKLNAECIPFFIFGKKKKTYMNVWADEHAISMVMLISEGRLRSSFFLQSAVPLNS